MAGALRFDEDGSGAEDLEPKLARDSPGLSIIEDEPGVIELEAQTHGFALADTEMSGDHAVIDWATERAYIDPGREGGPAVRRFCGDRRRDNDSTEESGQDLELIDPAERDKRAGVGYDGWSCHASSAARSASHSFSVVR